MDALALARVQFAANITFHILFPAITIGLAWLLVYFKARENRTGEGRWREWSDATGKFKIIARYISRTESDVTIRKQDGSDVTIPIDRLAVKLRRQVRETPITGKETLIAGVNPIRVGD